MRRRLATIFESASIAQLIQVGLLPRRLRLTQILGVSSPQFRFLNHVRYKNIVSEQYPFHYIEIYDSIRSTAHNLETEN